MSDYPGKDEEWRKDDTTLENSFNELFPKTFSLNGLLPHQSISIFREDGAKFTIFRHKNSFKITLEMYEDVARRTFSSNGDVSFVLGDPFYVYKIVRLKLGINYHNLSPIMDTNISRMISGDIKHGYKVQINTTAGESYVLLREYESPQVFVYTVANDNSNSLNLTGLLPKASIVGVGLHLCFEEVTNKIVKILYKTRRIQTIQIKKNYQ